MIVTLLTDFGTEDYFVGAMKGVILSRNPRIRIIDITHQVPPHDIEAAAFLLSAVYADFPSGTVHLVVVDPGVGSEREAVALKTSDYYFVGPDNGVFEHVLGREAQDARAIENGSLRRTPVSSTFHGRDIFAPAAAALADGFPFAEVGPKVEVARLKGATNVTLSGDGFEGRILHIDHFGNCVTSFRPGDLPGGPAAYEFIGDGWKVDELRSRYAGAIPEHLFLIVGSAGYLEVSMYGAPAAATFGIARGDRVRAVPRRERLADSSTL